MQTLDSRRGGAVTDAVPRVRAESAAPVGARGALAAGTILGPYRVVAPLGSGGMGDVYRAVDTLLDRTIAVKLLRRQDDADRRLLREARSVAALNHPSICVIHEVAEHEGRSFIVMEHIEGRPLSHLIGDTGLPTDQVLRLGIQVADALAHAHERGIVHRDLKSANVLVTPEGRAKILDFGLATRVQRDGGQVVTHSHDLMASDGGVVGTLPYLAPEVLRGQPSDTRADVWALGVMLYEMASGRRPFNGDTVFDLTASILRDPAPMLDTAGTEALAGVVMQCLARDPARRPARAGTVCTALERARLDTTAPRKPPTPAPPRVSDDLPSVAVLPLANLSGDPEQDYLCAGIAEEIINALARVEGVRVASRTSAFRFHHSADLAEIQQALQVGTVLEGSVRRVGDRLRIAVSLVDLETGYHRWSERYDRDGADVFAVQDEIARRVVDSLQIELGTASDAPLVGASTRDRTAYHLYLKGRYHLNQRTPADMRQAIELFEEAILSDRGYAQAYAGLADAYGLLAFHGSVLPRAVWPKAKRAAEEAIRLDPDAASAHASLGLARAAFDWDWSGAEASFRRSLELNPADPTAHHWLGISCLGPTGRLDEAERALRRALELDPLSPSINTSLGGILHDSRQFEAAIAQYRRTVDLAPAFYFVYWNLGRTYGQLGRHEEALAAFERASALAPTSAVARIHVARAHARLGHRDVARRMLDESLERRQREYVDPLMIALVYLTLGDAEQGFASLDEACEDRAAWLIWTNVSPAYDALRGDPRFQRIIERLGLGPSRPVEIVRSA